MKPLGIFVFGVINIFFFIFFMFKVFLYCFSFYKEDDKPYKKLDKYDELPKYTILLPVFKEASVVDKLVNRIDRLEWDKDKLEVFLLVEYNDNLTQQALIGKSLPKYVKVLIVPKGPVQTKPYACHYATQFVTGKYLVIYDAEDIPEKDQLLKAYQKFLTGDENLACVQSKLNYYNKDENWLAALFTIDYTTWFDGFIKGLSKLDVIIPLGGTSNHFKVDALKAVGWWDFWNVTEDADLGIVLAENGYQTQILDSTTWEESCYKPKAWIKQRQRWTMGYMITSLVHFRGKIELSPKDSIVAFLFITGTPLSNLFVPVVFTVTICNYFFGMFGELFPYPINQFAYLTFWIGNVSMLVVSAIACLRRRYYQQVFWCLLLPVYWLMSSIATYKALYQIFTAPHFWHKTEHNVSKVEVQ